MKTSLAVWDLYVFDYVLCVCVLLWVLEASWTCACMPVLCLCLCCSKYAHACLAMLPFVAVFYGKAECVQQRKGRGLCVWRAPLISYVCYLKVKPCKPKKYAAFKSDKHKSHLVSRWLVLVTFVTDCRCCLMSCAGGAVVEDALRRKSAGSGQMKP